MNHLWYYLALFGRSALKISTVAKLPNIASALLAWNLRHTNPTSKPFIVRIEPSSACNLSCPGCTTPVRRFPKDQVRVMTLDSFRKIYSEVAPYVCRLTFYMEGEPMTNRQLLEMVKLTGNSAFTSFSTNFTLMNDDLLQPLCNSGLDLIHVCLDGFTQEVFEKYRVGGNVDRVKHGLRKLMEYKRTNGFRKPFVNVYTILFRHVVPERHLIKQFCDEIRVDRLTFRPDQWNSLGEYTYSARKLPYKKCFWPWLSINVGADGSVYPCPIAYERMDRRPYGNLLKNDLTTVWNNTLYQQTRKFLSTGVGGNDGAIPCSTCRWYGPAAAGDFKNHSNTPVSELGNINSNAQQPRAR